MTIGYTQEGTIPDPTGPIEVYVVEYEPGYWRAHFKRSGYFATGGTAESAFASLQATYPAFFRGQDLQVRWLRCVPVHPSCGTSDDADTVARGLMSRHWGQDYDAMRDGIAAALKDAYEDCARICDQAAEQWAEASERGWRESPRDAANNLAASIRLAAGLPFPERVPVRRRPEAEVATEAILKQAELKKAGERLFKAAEGVLMTLEEFGQDPVAVSDSTERLGSATANWIMVADELQRRR